ncbi:MAG: FHA domain-containing protein [Cyanobacteria bacterium P01_D01_bin.50]
MQNLTTLQTIGLDLELFHTQSKTSFEILPNYPVIRIGKPNEKVPIDIDVLELPNSDIISRVHAEIIVENNTYYLIDLGSSNGTFLNGNKLETHIRYPLNLGDRIDLGHDRKVTFIFQYKKQSQQTAIVTNQPTTIQPQVINNSHQVQAVDRKSKLVGLVSMVIGVLIFAGNTRIGFGIGFPTILLCIGGVVILLQRQINRNWGYALIGLGAGLILFSGRLFASANLLAIFVSVSLIFAGYKLFKTGKIFGYSLNSIKGLLKARKEITRS